MQTRGEAVRGGRGIDRSLGLAILAALLVTSPALAQLQIERDVTVGGMVSDRFTWRDAAGELRVAVLAHNDGQTGPGGSRGGELREFRYEALGGTRVVAAPASLFGGFGYVVSHPQGNKCIPGTNDSDLGHIFPGTFTRVFEGRHHAILRFEQIYPRNCATGAPPAAPIDLPITIEWMMSTGRDHPLWAITWDLSAIPVDTLEDDARAPYGELLFDGSPPSGSHSVIAGVGWGDGYKFESTTNPVTYDSAWTWDVPNTIPYVKLWTTTVDATMGTVQTQPIAQQDAGGYGGVRRWNTTSAAGNGCASPASLMLCDFNWPYQSLNYAFGGGRSNPTNNTRLAWGTNFGFLGQTDYHVHGSRYWGGPWPDAPAPGHPRKSYSTYVVLGEHSDGPVEDQVTQVETAQLLTFTAATGTATTGGPAGVGRPDTITYPIAGYNPVYGALALTAAGNQVDVNIAVGAGTLEQPLLIVGNYTAGAPTVLLDGVTLTADVDYFASPRSATNELWLTLDRPLTGVINRLQIQPGCAPPTTPVNELRAAKLGVNLVVTWTDIVGATGYRVYHDATPGGAFTILTGTAASGNPGLTVAPPAGNLVFLKVAGEDACGVGPL